MSRSALAWAVPLPNASQWLLSSGKLIVVQPIAHASRRPSARRRFATDNGRLAPELARAAGCGKRQPWSRTEGGAGDLPTRRGPS